MTTAGGSGTGMETGTDYVAARLSVDIPEGSAQGIREITQEVERFRVTMEATTRAEADMARYLEQMGEAGKRATEIQNNLTQSLQTYLALAGRSTGQFYGGVPSGPFQQPFSGMQAGMGTPTPAYRPPNPADVSSQLATMPQNSQREYLNMQQVRGNIAQADLVSLTPQTVQDLSNKLASREKALTTQAEKTDANPPQVSKPIPRPGSPSPYEEASERVKGGASLAGQVMHEMGTGGENMGMGEMMVQGLNWARRRFSPQAAGRPGPPATTGSYPAGMPPEGAPGMGSALGSASPEGEAAESAAAGGGEALGGLGSFTKLLGPVAGIATAALSVFGLIQKGGEEIQGMRNVGSIRGGAAGEGFQAESRERMMSAMNPFISRDQARQIFQAAMSEGYADASGGGADNVIDFMKTNLTSMNISVADSAKMLRSTIIGSGHGDKDSVNASIGMLREELDTIRTMSRGGVISTPDYTKGVMNLQNQLMAQGGSPAGARNAAMLAEQVGSGDHATAGQFAELTGDLSSSVQGEAWLRVYGGYKIPGNLDPEAVSGYLQDQGELPQATWNALRHIAQMAKRRDDGSSVGQRDAVTYFQRLLRSTPAGNSQAAHNYGAAKAMYLKLLEGTGLSEAQQQMDEHPMGAAGPSADFTPPSGGDQLPTPSAPSGTGPSGAEAGPSTADLPSIGSYGGGGGGGGSHGAVTVDLTPNAAKLLQVLGPNPSPLTPTQRGANAGRSGAALNDPGA